MIILFGPRCTVASTKVILSSVMSFRSIIQTRLPFRDSQNLSASSDVREENFLSMSIGLIFSKKSRGKVRYRIFRASALSNFAV